LQESQLTQKLLTDKEAPEKTLETAFSICHVPPPNKTQFKFRLTVSSPRANVNDEAV
jgi:hypothetical protein